jgi:peptide-methionine (S)-S-oxide reductase
MGTGTENNHSGNHAETGAHETIVLGGGCFWCLEAMYQRLSGVLAVRPGYAGGTVPSPGYEQVCTGETGHAEVVLVEYDPKQVSLGEILDFFWKAHDPTTLNRQGADIGTQYRSIILYNSDAQKDAAVRSRDAHARDFPDPVVTEITGLDEFYPAEPYHENYYNTHPGAGYCRAVIAPKLQKLATLLYDAPGR